MKFAIVLVMLALALGAQSSVVPWPVVWPGPLSYTAVHGPPTVVVQHPLGPHVVVGGSTVVAGASSVVAAHPAVVVAAPVSGTYVAKTRGAVHVAPLPGHSNSASSVNLQPAPGTV